MGFPDCRAYHLAFVALMTRQAQQPPTILLATDFHQTIGWPGEKTALFSSLGLDRKALLADFRPVPRSRSSVQVQQMDYLRASMVDQRIVPITVEDMTAFGQQLQFYPHVESAFRRYKDIAAAQGARLVVAVVTNAWQPILEASSLVRDGVIDVVYGQPFQNRTIRGTVVACPRGSVDASAKPLAVTKLMHHYRVDGPHTLFLGNGEGDIPALRSVNSMRGRAIVMTGADALHPPHDPATGRHFQDARSIRHMEQDAAIAASLDSEGVLAAVLPADYQIGSIADRYLSSYVHHLARDAAELGGDYRATPVRATEATQHLTALA